MHKLFSVLKRDCLPQLWYCPFLCQIVLDWTLYRGVLSVDNNNGGKTQLKIFGRNLEICCGQVVEWVLTDSGACECLEKLSSCQVGEVSLFFPGLMSSSEYKLVFRVLLRYKMIFSGFEKVSENLLIYLFIFCVELSWRNKILIISQLTHYFAHNYAYQKLPKMPFQKKPNFLKQRQRTFLLFQKKKRSVLYCFIRSFSSKYGEFFVYFFKPQKCESKNYIFFCSRWYINYDSCEVLESNLESKMKKSPMEVFDSNGI